MSKSFSRRQFLRTALAASALPILTDAVHRTPPAPKRLVAGTRMLEVNGRPAKVFGLTGPDGRPGIRLAAGERFRVELANETGARTLVHWHGQLPPWPQECFPWPQTPPIPAGETQSYDYAPIPGTFWMHSHQGLQEQNLMTAPLIVHSAEDLRADRQEVVLLLHVFSFRTPDELLAGLTKPDSSRSAMPMSHGRTTTNGSGSMGAMNMSPMNMGAMSMAPDMAPDLNDIDYDAFLANDRTLADPDVIPTEAGGRVRLRLINGASATQFWIDLGALTGTAVAVDGHPARPGRGTLLPPA